jgi:hypothetical protein
MNVVISTSLRAAEETVMKDDLKSGLDKWETPSNRYIEIIDGLLANKTTYSSSISLKEKNIGNFQLSFRLTFFEDNDVLPGHFRIDIDRGYGTWRLFFTRHDKLSQITSKFYPRDAKKGDRPLFDEVINTPLPLMEWLDIAILCNNDSYILKIGDKSFLLGTAPGRGGITIGSYKQPFAVDNFKIVYSNPEELSLNLLINSSFEYSSNPDIPDYWAGNGERYRHKGLPDEFSTADGIKDFRENFYLDQTQAYHGERSIRIGAPFNLTSQGIDVIPGRNYHISCYIKSDISDLKVVIGATHDNIGKPVKEEMVTVGKEWRYYDLQLPDYPQDRLSFYVKPVDSGKIWVDAVQIEEGITATPYSPCWYDTGFNLPCDANKNQCSNNVNGIKSTLERRDIVSSGKLDLTALKLVPKDPVKHVFDFEFDIKNVAEEDSAYGIAVVITSKTSSEQIKTCNKQIPRGKTVKIRFDSFVIDDLRCCINIIATNSSGTIIKHTREFVDLPQPMRIYPEYSFYTNEKDARIVVQFDSIFKDKIKDCKLLLEVIVAGYHQYPLEKHNYDLSDSKLKQIFSISTARLSPKIYNVKATVVDKDGKAIIQSEAELNIMRPSATEVKINRINRGVYVNGKPFLPYGILVSGFGEKQLQYYRECGFSYIQFISHWKSPEINMKFLASCERLGISAIAFHVSRPYTAPPYEAAASYRASPAFVGIVPNDESADRIVYEEAGRTKNACPERLIWINHNFHSYRAFANRLDGFPGDVLSIDRYPFIMQPPGRPQSTNDIYSIEQVVEMMNRDGIRERKPVFLWLQGAERFSKEPTPQQLTWQTYISLVNNCMGFTYFGGIPDSERVWTRMIELNKEIQSLTPALFSLEDEPEIITVGKISKDNIRFLAKKLDNELTVICVNRSLSPVEAFLDLSSVGVKVPHLVEVLFENRKFNTDDEGILKDKFDSMERHVYRIKL